MELTDERIIAVRKMWDGAHTAKAADIVAICDAALAHNAAKRVEPVAWARIGVNEEIISLSAFKTDWNTTPLYEAAAAPPDLAAKLKEARELLAALHEETYRHSTGSLSDKVDDFLARTKP